MNHSKFYVLGAGAIGLLHSIFYTKKYPNSVYLLQRGSGLSGPIHVEYEYNHKLESYTLNQEYIDTNQDVNSPRLIKNLLICTKAYQAKDAVSTILPRITQNTNIVILTNGVLKVYDELKQFLPLNPMIIGSTTHGVVKNNKYSIIHTGLGKTICGQMNGQSNQLLESFSRGWDDLGYKTLCKKDIFRQMQIKIAINACINSLAATLNCRNGLLDNEYSRTIINGLCREISIVFDIPLEELEGNVMDVIQKTRDNLNSMDVDLKNKNKTEVDYITGYILELGRNRGIDLKINETMFNLVKAKEFL